MPEGPEIRRAADRVEHQLAGGTIEHVWFAFEALKPHTASLIGRRVERVETRGKAMLTRFDDGRVLYSHNQLYGVWKLHRADEPPQTTRSLRARLVVDGRAASLYSASSIAMWHADTLGQQPFLARLGPDLLSEAVSEDAVLARLNEARFKRRGLGGLLLDQGFVAGLGNYLRSEILFFAGLHPKRRPADLDDEQCRQLARYMLALTWQTYRSAGITNTPEWIEAAKAQGETRPQWRFAVFDRQGLACHRCQTPIVRTMVSSRRLYLCPLCQPESG
jgi:endonuclease-8